MSAEPAAPAAPPDARRTEEDPDALLREFGELTRRNRDIDAEKRRNNERLEQIHDRCLAIFEQRNQRAVDFIGIGNLHLIKDGRAKIVRRDGDYTRDVTDDERERAKQALIAAGWHDLLREQFNLNAVTGRCKEVAEQGEHLPAELTDIDPETGQPVAGILYEERFKLGLTT